MPTVVVDKNELFHQIGKTYSSTEFDELCFAFGLETDGEQEMPNERMGVRIEVPANRYDLLCREGIGLALSAFEGTVSPPQFTLHPSTPTETVYVNKSVYCVRPFILAAILRDVEFNPSVYASFIDLQDKLHHNIGRKRSLISIGTHDLDKIKGPFYYSGVDPLDIEFVPLNYDKRMNGVELMASLENHQQLKHYLPLILNKPLYPVFSDSTSTVCSLPPIINSEYSKIDLDTRNVFIEVTANDLTKAKIALVTIASAFSFHSKNKFRIEPVRVEYEESNDMDIDPFIVSPDVSERLIHTSLSYIRKICGILSSDLTESHVCELLERMMIPSTSFQCDKSNDILVQSRIPCTRSDILHPCDIAEDVAISYGYDNISDDKWVMSDDKIVSELPISTLCENLRSNFALCKYQECQNWSLLSFKENYANMCRSKNTEDDLDIVEVGQWHYQLNPIPAQLGNSKTNEFEILRTTLMPGLIKTLYANQHHELPIRIFEIGDCVRLSKRENGTARNFKMCSAIYANVSNSGLEEVHGLLDTVLYQLGLRAIYEDISKPMHRSSTHPISLTHSLKKDNVYKLVPFTDPSFLPERSVKIIVGENMCIGVMGVVHPDVLSNNKVPFPCSMFEITLNPLVTMLTPLEINIS